jgi:hypothetical protein
VREVAQPRTPEALPIAEQCAAMGRRRTRQESLRAGSARRAHRVHGLQSPTRMAPRLENRVIARFLDGTLVRGTTFDFAPTKTSFHVDDGHETREIDIADLKALFFVRDFEGDASYNEKKGFFTPHAHGKKVMVEFLDGEVIFGYTMTYTSRGFGFFVFPGDPGSNNEKVFIVHGATRRVKLRSASGAADYGFAR